VPGILDFASSVAGKSPYVDLPRHGQRSERSAAQQIYGPMSELWCRSLQGVKTNADAERVSLGTAQGKVERLGPGRIYY
jgi:hypothetical protein